MTTNQENNSYSHWSGRFLACLDVSLIPLYPHFNGHQLEIHCWTSNRIDLHEKEMVSMGEYPKPN